MQVGAAPAKSQRVFAEEAVHPRTVVAGMQVVQPVAVVLLSDVLVAVRAHRAGSRRASERIISVLGDDASAGIRQGNYAAHHVPQRNHGAVSVGLLEATGENIGGDLSPGDFLCDAVAVVGKSCIQRAESGLFRSTFVALPIA